MSNDISLKPDTDTTMSCNRCSGSGWELFSVDGVEQVRRCQCQRDKFRHNLWKETRVPERFRNCCLDKFDTYTQVNGKQTIDINLSIPKQICATFIKKYPAVEQGLLLMGAVGVGKTHLAVSIIAELTQKKGASCLFYDFRDLLKSIQSSYDPRSQISELSILEPVVNCELLVLDELGARKVTDWMLDMLNYIINKRYNDHKITIITSNWTDKAGFDGGETLTDRVGPRIRSRLREMCTEVMITGKDYRQRKKSSHDFNF